VGRYPLLEGSGARAYNGGGTMGTLNLGKNFKPNLP